MKAISATGLSKRYGKVKALDGLSLSIDEGAIFGFLGPNGAGKTTAVRLLTGLSRPSGGAARVLGEDASRGSASLRGAIGYLPEEPSFYNWMTGREFLLYVGGLFRLPAKENKRRCDELLGFAGLGDAALRRIGGYSRGMRQRLGLAQALMNRPRVLFLDEPCSALDPIGRREVLDTIIALRSQTTIFMSTHILSDVERVCDTVGIVDRGRLIAEERTDVLRERFAQPLFRLQVEGETSALEDMLRTLPWVVAIDVERDGEDTALSVRVSDVALAKRELPGIVSGSGAILLQYELASPSLEEVFIRLVGERGKP